MESNGLIELVSYPELSCEIDTATLFVSLYWPCQVRTLTGVPGFVTRYPATKPAFYISLSLTLTLPLFLPLSQNTPFCHCCRELKRSCSVRDLQPVVLAINVNESNWNARQKKVASMLLNEPLQTKILQNLCMFSKLIRQFLVNYSSSFVGLYYLKSIADI